MGDSILTRFSKVSASTVVTMEKVSYDQIADGGGGMNSADMREAVVDAQRFAEETGRTGYNADLSAEEMKLHCMLGKEEKAFISNAYESLCMSPRAYVRALKVARTIADLDRSENIKDVHLAEALSYRMS